MEMLLQALLPSKPAVPVIHVAGTNGKGSICAMLESVLRHAGYRTGLYTSPFLQVYQERIRLDGKPISDALMEKYGTPLVKAYEKLQAQGVTATPFELGTALALSAFEGEKVDFAIVEVGLGGRLDPTNIVSPILCGIAAIGRDHMQFLGDTVEEIAAEKAGIIKENVPVVCHPAVPSVAAVFRRTAEEKHAPLTQLHYGMLGDAAYGLRGSTADFILSRPYEDVSVSLPGEHQLTNTLTVVAMVEQLRAQGYEITDEALREGLQNTHWPARLEWCGNILIDGAHNQQGIAALRKFVQSQLAGKKRVLVTGILTEKVTDAMLGDLCAIADTAVTVTPDTPRAMEAADYAALLRKAGISAEPADNVTEALEKAAALAGDEGIIVASGSLYFAGMVRNALHLNAI
ncbi:MAG: folylpolyglutamate synthase/dihydrofolate synthase family protein [Clostridia bacterium]|nr:folylpolyglutamate synthase/dihydrofolate synthase family protein [Clostridia bacterium]